MMNRKKKNEQEPMDKPLKNAGTVLLVEDDHSQRRWLSKILENAGYQVGTAENGKVGYDVAIENIPDIILMDVEMPEMDGYQCCRALQDNPLTAHVPVIFLSGKTEAEDIVQGLEAGGIDYLTKPFDRKELLARIAVQLRHSFREVRDLKYSMLARHVELYMTKGFMTEEEVMSLAQWHGVKKVEIKKLAESGEQRAFWEIDRHLTLLARKGFVTKDEVAKLAAIYTVSKKQVQQRVKVPIKKKIPAKR